MKTIIIFLVVDELGVTWGVAPTMVQARVQANWFLPKGGKYHIETQLAYSKR
jgi:hypothetical protein